MELITTRFRRRRRRRAAGFQSTARHACSIAALLLVTGLASPAESAFGAQSLGTISGEVTSASSHAPVKGIEVCALNSELLAEAEPEEEGRAFGCAKTDARGAYTISELRPEEGYAVVFSAPVASKLNYITQYYEGAVPPAEGTVTVTPGKTTSGVNAALETGAQITGRLTDASTGAAIEGATVFAFRSTGGGTLEVASYAFSGPTGAYDILGLASGSYGVVFVAQGYVVQYYNGALTPAAAASVAVTAPGLTSGIDARLGPGNTESPPLALIPTAGTPPGTAPTAITLGALLPGDELVPITPITSSVTAGALSLASTRISVRPGGVALVKVNCGGSLPCSAKIALRMLRTVTVKGGRVHRIVTIATAPVIAVPAARKATVKMRLDRAARATLRAAHGRLTAELAMVTAGRTRRASVLLSEQLSHT